MRSPSTIETVSHAPVITPESYTSGFSGMTTLTVGDRSRITLPKKGVTFQNQPYSGAVPLRPIALSSHPGVIFLVPLPLLHPHANLTKGSTPYRDLIFDSLGRSCISREMVQALTITRQKRKVVLTGCGPYCTLTVQTNSTAILDSTILAQILHPDVFVRIFPSIPTRSFDPLSHDPRALARAVRSGIVELLGLPPDGDLVVDGIRIHVTMAVRVHVSIDNGLKQNRTK